MITVTDLHKQFKAFHALRGIDLHVKKGEIYGFIGQNGAGKSTTMNILTGLSRPTSGECIVNGRNVKTLKHPSELQVGYLPEDPRFYPWMSAYETLEFLGNNTSSSVKSDRIREVLGWVGLTEAARRRVGGFSRGMKQRLGIAAALIHNPELVILDEPSSALDPEGRSDVLRLIKDLKEMGKTVFFSTHILSDVERVCDTVGMITAGTMVMEKPLKEIQENNIVPVYDVVLQAAPGQPVIEKLKQLEGITRVTIKSSASLAVTATDAASASARLMEFLVENKLAVESFALRKNDLEGIFIQEVNTK